MDNSFSRRKFLAASAVSLGAATVPATALAATTAADTASTCAMPRRPLGKTGWMVSIVAFGGGSRFMLQDNLETAEKMLHRAIELGINYFDTAYGYQQKGVRESYIRYSKFLVPKYRKQIFLASKLMARDGETAKKDFDTTLKELGTDHLDILHFHDLRKGDVDKIIAENGALKVYRKLKEQGLIRAIGVTGHTSGDIMIDAIKRIEPDCIMCPQNAAHSGDLSGGDFAKVIPVALERGLGMLAMKSTARNGLIGRNGVTAEQLVRYTLNLPVASTIIGMPSLEVVESCCSIARSLTPLDEKEKLDLEQKLAGAALDGSIPYLAHDYRDGHHECMG